MNILTFHTHSSFLRFLTWSLFTLFSFGLFGLCSVSGHETHSTAASPNVIFILADDLGYSDTTLFGTTSYYKTPHIQQLASRGMVFDHAYSCSPLCSPTRSSILTGLSPARVGITSPNCHSPKVVLNAEHGTSAGPTSPSILPESATRLNTTYYTLSDALKDAGYATAHFGKWHLGAEPYSPLQQSFDSDIPHWPGPGPAGSYVAPWKFPDFDPQTPQEHIEDRMALEAKKFIEDHKDKPFFLNYWMFSVHAPFDAKQDLIDQYAKTVNTQDAQQCPTYAAMIESMDDAVGTLMETVDQLGLTDNTIFIFASDNGGNMYNEVNGVTPTSNRPLRGGKATMYEGGIRTPAVVVWPALVPPGTVSHEVIQSSDYYPTLLELLKLLPQTGQSFDGISIVPALQGQPLNREAIFTYFPHAPAVPDWLPASVSVHRGDWKLIRLFYAGENGSHRWKLFNLADDLGETNDQATQKPELVAELDQLIENFLKETNAVLPLPNPKFDFSKYDLSKEGQNRRPPEKDAKTPPKKTKPQS